MIRWSIKKILVQQDKKLVCLGLGLPLWLVEGVYKMIICNPRHAPAQTQNLNLYYQHGPRPSRLEIQIKCSQASETLGTQGRWREQNLGGGVGGTFLQPRQCGIPPAGKLKIEIYQLYKQTTHYK